MSLRSRARVPVALIAIAAVAIALAGTWAVRLPLFAAPDESAHFDYALELYAVGRPFKVAAAKPVRISSPVVRYLQTAVRYRENRYNYLGRLPAGYGSGPFFAGVDAAAPQPDSRVPPAGSAMPYVMFAYPAGYYAATAIAMHAAELLHPHSIVAAAFAARFTSVACLAATIAFGYGIFVRMRLSKRTALLATTGVAWLPLTSWVSGYVQPDNLSTSLVTAALYVALRWKERPDMNRWPALLAVTLVALSFVKQHYALATLLATFGAALGTVRSRRGAVRLAAVFVPALGALAAATWFVPVARIGALHFAGQRQGTSIVSAFSPADVARGFANGLASVYGGGDAFTDFWLRFGTRGATVYRGSVRAAVADLLLAATLAVACAFGLRTYSVLRRLARVARRSLPLAVRLAIGDPVINVYLLVTALMLAVYVASRGNMWLEGRYWLPVIVPTVALGVAVVPRLLRGRARRAGALAVASLWASYAAISAPAALAALDRNFYHQPQQTPAFEPYAEIRDVEPAGRCARVLSPVLSFERGCALSISGYAVDSERGLPARDVFLTVDGRPRVRAATGTPSPLVRDVYGDDALADSGFHAVLDTALLANGSHDIGIDVVERRAPQGLAAHDTVRVDVREP